MKSFTASKINWIAILTVLLGALTSAQQLDLSPEVMGYILGAIGILNFVLRTFFTNTVISVNEKG